MTQEEHQLERFVEIAGVEGDLEFTDSPDLLVRRKERTVGIEHTRLLQPQHPNTRVRLSSRDRDSIARDL